MSRRPPPDLTEDESRTLNHVRRDIWTNAGTGFVTGSLTGIVLHSAAQFSHQRGFTKLKVNSNTALLSILLGGAFGSYLMASTTGKNQVHKLHPIFDKQSQKEELQKNRLLRRASLKQKMQHGHGLTDAHGGHWESTKEFVSQNDLERNRLVRHKSMQQSIQHGHGLSDSHGGRWVRK